MALRQSNGAPSVEQQPRYLAEASACKSGASTPKKRAGAGTARCAPTLVRHVRELRTSLLTPRLPELYMKVCDELRHSTSSFNNKWTGHPQQTYMKEPRLVGMCYRDCIC